MDRFAGATGRHYHLFDYVGAPDAERVIVLMGSGRRDGRGDRRVRWSERGEKVGVVKVRLFRPFAVEHFLAALPPTVRTLAVLDRTKEPGSSASRSIWTWSPRLHESNGRATTRASSAGATACRPRSSRRRWSRPSSTSCGRDKPRNHFTVGINDDVTHTSLDFDPDFATEDPDTVRAVFYGLGSDGTVGANKNSIKIIGEETRNYAQGYFVYDSKKSGSVTVSHLRFGPRPIRSTYLISRADFVACHQFSFLERIDVLGEADAGRDVPAQQPLRPGRGLGPAAARVQEQIIDKKLRFFVIDAYQWPTRTAWAAASTRSCRPASSPSAACCRASEAIARSRRRSTRPTASAARRRARRTSRPWMPALAHLHEVPRARPRSTVRCRPAAGRAGRRAGVRAQGDRADASPARATRCRSAPCRRRHLADRHDAVGEAQHRPGDPGLGRRRSASSAASACWSARTR